MRHETIFSSFERGHIYLHFGVRNTFLSYVRAELFKVEVGKILMSGFRNRMFCKPSIVAKMSNSDCSRDVDVILKKDRPNRSRNSWIIRILSLPRVWLYFQCVAATKQLFEQEEIYTEISKCNNFLNFQDKTMK